MLFSSPSHNVFAWLQSPWWLSDLPLSLYSPMLVWATSPALLFCYLPMDSCCRGRGLSGLSRGLLLPPTSGSSHSLLLACAGPFSGSFHRFGGCSFHILRWKCLSAVLATTPLDPLPRRGAPANGAHMYGGAGGRQAGLPGMWREPLWAWGHIEEVMR